MTFNINYFKVCIFGYNPENINSMASNFPDYKIQKIILTEGVTPLDPHSHLDPTKKYINETNVYNHYLTYNIDTHDVLFVNADSVKKVKIEGTESLHYIISMIETKLKEKLIY